MKISVVVAACVFSNCVQLTVTAVEKKKVVIFASGYN